MSYRNLSTVVLCLLILPLSSQQWQTLNASSGSWRFEDVFFIDGTTGWAVDGSGLVIRTVDGGATWETQLNMTDQYFRSVEFLDSEIGFVATLGGLDSDAQLYRTLDGGSTWTEITENMPTSVVGICGMDAVGNSTLFITGTFWTSAFIMRSDDLGDTWTYMDMGNLANGLVDIEFKNSSEGIAVGQSAQGTGLKAVVLGTSDGGQTWQQRSIGTADNQRSWKIQYLTENVVYASIEEFEPTPQYFKSVDGGQTWNLMDLVTTQPGGTMQGIGFLNEDHGWIGGWGDLLFETTDGGQTWEYQPGIVGSMNRFFRVSDQKMFAGGQSMYCYEDPTATGLLDYVPIAPDGHRIEWSGQEIIIELVGHTYMELSVHDANGKSIVQLDRSRRNMGTYRFDFDGSKYPSGLYHIALYTYHGYDSMSIHLE